MMKTCRVRISAATFVVAAVVVCDARLFLAPPSARAATEEKYQKAAPAMREILDVPPTPVVSLSPTRDRLVLVQASLYPPLSELAQPMIALAGYRINPQSNGPHRPPRYVGLTLKDIATGVEQPLPVPSGAYLGFPQWSPDGRLFAVASYQPDGVELWLGDATSGVFYRLRNVALNAAFGPGFQRMPDSKKLLCQTLVPGRGKAPERPRVPAGPGVQETQGKVVPTRTFQDLLADAFDEELFDYYATAQLVLVNASTAEAKLVGKPGLFRSFESSPDGQHILVERVRRPYSFNVPASFFPREVEALDLQGRLEFKIGRLPLAEEVPIGGVVTGPRNTHWRPTAPATLVWVEVLDGGDPKKRVPYRDRVMTCKLPGEEAPAELVRTEHRFAGLIWGEKSWVALLKEYQSSKRSTRTYLINPDDSAVERRLLWEVSAQDRYNDPGTPMSRTLATGFRGLRVFNNSIYLTGNGASAEGDRPFLSRLNLGSLETERLFQAGEQTYESVVALATDDAAQIITRQEAPGSPPNYFLRTLADHTRKALTEFADPFPQLRGIKKQLVSYERDDGVPLSFTLYLPADHKPGTRLPTLVWAYPREFIDNDTAGQVAGSPFRYTSFQGASHLFLLTQGYAILDGATMPVVGEGNTANNTYIEQIVASAKAAIDKAVELGVTDRNRVAVGGHSYGAFMAANLAAHSDLFRACIARSGAYNRTLTPFGFQNEKRTLWEAPELYSRLSPIMHADKIKEPMLLIHGEADNNPGTPPVQTERFFQAIKGTGGTARLVLLPHEAHNYEARESVETVLTEMTAWLDKHVKNAAVPEAANTVPQN